MRGKRKTCSYATWLILSKEGGFKERVVFRCRSSHAGAILFILHSVWLCVCVPMSSLYVLRNMCGPCPGCCSLKPPDEDAFQSDRRTQMLRLARGKHTQRGWRLRGVHHHWAQSKLFSSPDEASHYWKKYCIKQPLLELCLVLVFGVWVSVYLMLRHDGLVWRDSKNSKT